MAGQSLMDRVVAARHSIAGQGLAKSVCKATTEEVIGPKKKHLDYLLQCTNEPNVSIPQMADLLIERTQHTSWVVVYKSLISIHNLMNYGNERFTQYLASNNCSFNLSGFVDKGGVQGYDMSTFIRRYAKYLNEKAVSYRLMAFDFCKVKRGKDDGVLRTMNTDKLLKTIPILQHQLDALLEFDCSSNELTNGVITACFMLLFKDLIRLFACYNDGTINLLEKYFDMNKKQCKDGLDLYKKFLVRMDKVSEFLKVAEAMGIDKGDIPDLAKAPASLLDALEQHLACMEGKKAGTATTPTGPSVKPASFTTALNNMSTNTFDVTEAEKKRILEEENKQLQKLKAADETSPDVAQAEGDGDENIFEQRLKEASSPQKQPPATNNPFAASSPSSAAPPTSIGQSNLLGSPTEPTGASRPSDDLLNLANNPFMDNMGNAGGFPAQPAPNPFGSPGFQTNGISGTAGGFTSEADFAKAFSNGSSNTQAGSGFGTTLTMAPTSSSAPPELDLGAPLDPLEGGGTNSRALSPAPLVSTDPGLCLPQVAPTQSSASTALLEGLDTGSFGQSGQGQSSSNIPSPIMMDSSSFGASMTPQMGFPPIAAPAAQLTQGGSFMGQYGMGAQPPAMPATTGTQFYNPGSQSSMPMVVPGGVGSSIGAGTQPTPMSSGTMLGMGGSPIRIMTRGGKSPAASLSSSPSGPGLEDAVKALGLSMSPSKGGAGKASPLVTGRSTSPNQPMMSGGAGNMGGGDTVMASGIMATQAGSGFAELSAPMGNVGLTEEATGGAGLGQALAMGQEGAQAGQGFDAFGDVLLPGNKTSPSHQSQANPQAKQLGGDLDSSLASIATNLNVSGGAGQLKKDHQWQPKGENKLTGGNAFQRQPIAQSTTTTWGQTGFQQPTPMMGAAPVGAPMMYNQAMTGMTPQPMMGMAPQPMGMPMQPGMAPMPMQQPAMFGQPRPPMMGSGFQQFPQQQQQQMPAPSSSINDPFGAL